MRIRNVLFVVVAAVLLVAPLALAGEKVKGDKEKGAKGQTVMGIVASVAEKGDSITLQLKKGDKGAAETKTIAIDADTKISKETGEMESVPGEGGKVKQKPKVVEATAKDLAAGQRVAVGCTEDGSKAVKILILSTQARKAGAEGEGKKHKEGK
ncbi:MAG: hypothetical protein FJ288_06460 [Planctomycetes bacterium]|nr:hypothetical protein [Planctomycetota bacterium]